VALRGKPGVSPETRSRIAAVAEELGYRPDITARRLRQDRSRLLGVTFSLAQAFHPDVVRHLYDAAAAHECDLVLSAVTSGRPVARAAENLLGDRCEALLLITSDMAPDGLATLGERAAVVTIGSEATAPGVDSVRSDDRAGMRAAVDHVAGLGHRSVTYVDAYTPS
jgi:DNA-binding LacI/PurR family transcriptional regulator